MADKVYTENGYTYTVSDNGTVTAKGIVSENPASRKGMEKITPDGYDSKVDDKGHLIAAREGGVAADYNVSSQDRGLNRGAYKVVENAEIRLANEGYKVETEKIAYVPHTGEKPSAYMINDTITAPDGRTHTVNLSFTNLSEDEMDEINQTIDNMDIDDPTSTSPIPEGTTPEEYDQIMEETQDQLGSIKDEYDMDNSYTVYFGNEQPSIEESAPTGVLDNDTNDFQGSAPSFDSTESSGIFDNDANDFQGSAPSFDNSAANDASYGNDVGTGEGSDSGESSSSGESSGGGEASDSGEDMG